jgi:transketolase
MLASVLDRNAQNVKDAGAVSSSVYIRLARDKSPIVTTEETPFVIGKAQIFYEIKKDAHGIPKSIHHDVGIIACGALVYKAIKAAKDLEKEGIAAKVMNLATIKPLDADAIAALAKETGAIVTVEEHQIAGGMGSAVAECLASYTGSVAPHGVLVPIEFIGVHDKFGQSGKPEELLEFYGMGEKDIKAAVKKVLSRKQGK